MTPMTAGLAASLNPYRPLLKITHDSLQRNIEEDSALLNSNPENLAVKKHLLDTQLQLIQSRFAHDFQHLESLTLDLVIIEANINSENSSSLPLVRKLADIVKEIPKGTVPESISLKRVTEETRTTHFPPKKRWKSTNPDSTVGQNPIKAQIKKIEADYENQRKELNSLKIGPFKKLNPKELTSLASRIKAYEETAKRDPSDLNQISILKAKIEEIGSYYQIQQEKIDSAEDKLKRLQIFHESQKIETENEKKRIITIADICRQRLEEINAKKKP